MIQKRFNTLSSYLGMYTIFDENEGKPLADYEVVDLLNNLNKKKEWLEKENEQLKFQNSNLMKEVAEYSRKAKELEKKGKKN